MLSRPVFDYNSLNETGNPSRTQPIKTSGLNLILISMTILAIETSCDETAAAVYGETGLLSNVILSQAIHNQFGGVVPELASREHVRSILPIIRGALSDAETSLDQLDGVAVTQGPGLIGSLLVGINTAKGLCYALRIPLVAVNHIEGHIFSINLSREVNPPFIALVISGGHTLLVLVNRFANYQILGRTHDDAAGEAFDKVAKMLELGYPGGPVIDKLAREGNEKFIAFPRALMKSREFDFSFSGLKTAVLYYLKRNTEQHRNRHVADIVASFQAALVDVLVEKTVLAAKNHRINQVVIAGGVARNNYLRQRLSQRAETENLRVFIPEPVFCTDNAAMIAWVGFQKLKQGILSELNIAPVSGMNLATL